MTAFTGEVHPVADLLPLLDGEELRMLASDIEKHGLLHPLTVDADGLLLDGRNRLAACRLVGVQPRFVTFGGGDPVAFVLSSNLHRRHLTVGQKSMVATDLEAYYAAEAAKRQGARTDLAPPPGADELLVLDAPTVPDNFWADLPRSERPRERAGKAFGVSGRSVQQAKRLKDRHPDLAEQVMAGTVALDRAERIARDREAEQARRQRALEDAANKPNRPRIDLRLGDFRTVLADITGVDAIITDPPYPREYLHLLDDLATWAAGALTADGVLVVLMGQTHLPEVYRRLGGHLPYRWTMSFNTPGAAYTSQNRRVSSVWKPVLVYGAGPRFRDVITSTGDDKNHHHWGQNYDGIAQLVKTFARPGQTVADPFAGGGTTLLAALEHGCHAIGAEIDPQAHATATARLT